MKIKIEVKQRHINHGKRGHCSSCPIALAINNTNCFRDAWISPARFNGWYKNVYSSCKLPRSATRFIRRFDTGKEVKPFNFFLEVFV